MSDFHKPPLDGFHDALDSSAAMDFTLTSA